ncbi:hypothetical protein EYF80_001668 [Liparis tanakae]|uniref:Uncharacterized protein n=1 Tax=Liparis tanakae TaxID=230148 RepID=A0A4Z2JDN7_9TELE|nr:hypothetical protein EYF80_001668 [Liparis tanakae]
MKRALYEHPAASASSSPPMSSSVRSQIDEGSDALRRQENLHEGGHARLCIGRAVQTLTALFAKCHRAVFVRTKPPRYAMATSTSCFLLSLSLFERHYQAHPTDRAFMVEVSPPGRLVPPASGWKVLLLLHKLELQL